MIFWEKVVALSSQKHGRRFSAYEIAKLTGVSYQTTNKLSKNIRPPSQRTVNLIASWLEVSPEHLMNDVMLPRCSKNPPKDWKTQVLEKLSGDLSESEREAIKKALGNLEL